MEKRSLAVHRTIVAVDVEGFGDKRRTNQNQVAVRDGLYRAMNEAFDEVDIPWANHYYEDRGDGMFILISSEVPKSLLVESLPSALVGALCRHNSTHSEPEQIRLRMALHAGEVSHDKHGVAGASINLTFRLLESSPIKKALTRSTGLLAVITSSWFYDEVVRHCAIDASKYIRVEVKLKETITAGWIFLPDAPVTAAAFLLTSQNADDSSKKLASAYQIALKKSIIPAGEMSAGMKIPTLEEGYIGHRFRVAEVIPSAELGSESWWTEIPIRDDACRFVLASLTEASHAVVARRGDSTSKSRDLPRELKAPIILLGQPGSGKSVLTRILAARLPTTDFLPVRVELRQAPEKADLQSKIELAVYDEIGENIRWPQFVESSNCVMPVVMLDGFDELLQATGVAHYNFLERVQEFQEREADLDRPLAVIVSSRTAVTDRARIPPGATAMRLESFNEEQITAWLEIWARTNRISLAERNLQSLPAGVALNYEELAGQPLLLLMLALYDADGNALQHRSAALGRTELYGRLFKDFANREIRRRFGARFEADLENAVEAELLHLSIVAFAMFNRRSQWVRETDIDGDFRTLLVNGSSSAAKTWAKEAQLNAAQLIIGRFFFVNESHATRTYEFLHATFGEFLVARLVVKVLSERRTAGTAGAPWPSGGTDELLYALLSFEALTARNPIVAFVGDLLDQLGPQHRTDIADMLLRLHTRALFPPTESSYSTYEPLALPATTRHAAWSANLVVLAVLAAGKVTGSQLYPLETDTQLAWRAEALIWRSQLGGHGWEGLHETIALNRIWDGGRKEFRLSRNDGTFMPEALDMSWTFDVSPDPVARKEIFSSPSHNSLMTQRKINFVSNMSEDIMAHGLAPLVSSFPTTAHVFVVLSDERIVSAVHALISALCAPYQEGPLRESVYLDLAQVTRKLLEAPNVAQDASYLKMALGVLISAVDQGIVSLASAELLAGMISNMTTEDTKLTELLARLDSLLSDYSLTGNTAQKDKG